MTAAPPPDVPPLPVVEWRLEPTRLPCQVQRTQRMQPGERGSVVWVLNSGAHTLPRHARIAWATTGTPAAQGQWHQLVQPLAPGHALSIPLSTPLRGSGCIAALLR